MNADKCCIWNMGADKLCSPLQTHTKKGNAGKKWTHTPIWAFGDKLESYWKDTYKESKKNSSHCMEEKLVRNVFSPSAALMKSRDL